MGELQESQRKVIKILSVISIISPSILESQTLGAGENIVLDAVTHLDFVEGVFWGLLIRKDYVLGPGNDSINVIMPYLAFSVSTIFVWLLGCLAPVVVYLVLSQRLKFTTGSFVVIILSIVPFFPGIPAYLVEDLFTYIRTPLIIPQITSFITLAIYYWKQRKS